jgi:hypothetical protein
MLLNSDIQKKIVQMILHFQKKKSVIMYINEFIIKLNLNYFILNKLLIRYEWSKFMFL